jgi:hypothetical protein
VEHQSLFFPNGWKLLQLIVQIAPQKTLERIPFKKTSITRQNRKEVVAAIAAGFFRPS